MAKKSKLIQRKATPKLQTSPTPVASPYFEKPVDTTATEEGYVEYPGDTVTSLSERKAKLKRELDIMDNKPINMEGVGGFKEQAYTTANGGYEISHDKRFIPKENINTGKRVVELDEMGKGLPVTDEESRESKAMAEVGRQLSSSDKAALGALGLDLGAIFVPGPAQLIPAAASLGLNIYSDATNPEVSLGQTFGNAAALVGLEAVNSVTSLPVSVLYRMRKGSSAINALKNIMRISSVTSAIGTVATGELNESLSKPVSEMDMQDFERIAGVLGMVLGTGRSKYSKRRSVKKAALEIKDATKPGTKEFNRNLQEQTGVKIKPKATIQESTEAIKKDIRKKNTNKKEARVVRPVNKNTTVSPLTAEGKLSVEATNKIKDVSNLFGYTGGPQRHRADLVAGPTRVDSDFKKLGIPTEFPSSKSAPAPTTTSKDKSTWQKTKEKYITNPTKKISENKIVSKTKPFRAGTTKFGKLAGSLAIRNASDMGSASVTVKSNDMIQEVTGQGPEERADTLFLRLEKLGMAPKDIAGLNNIERHRAYKFMAEEFIEENKINTEGMNARQIIEAVDALVERKRGKKSLGGRLVPKFQALGKVFVSKSPGYYDNYFKKELLKPNLPYASAPLPDNYSLSNPSKNNYSVLDASSTRGDTFSFLSPTNHTQNAFSFVDKYKRKEGNEKEIAEIKERERIEAEEKAKKERRSANLEAAVPIFSAITSALPISDMFNRGTIRTSSSLPPTLLAPAKRYVRSLDRSGYEMAMSGLNKQAARKPIDTSDPLMFALSKKAQGEQISRRTAELGNALNTEENAIRGEEAAAFSELIAGGTATANQNKMNLYSAHRENELARNNALLADDTARKELLGHTVQGITSLAERLGQNKAMKNIKPEFEKKKAVANDWEYGGYKQRVADAYANPNLDQQQREKQAKTIKDSFAIKHKLSAGFDISSMIAEIKELESRMNAIYNK